MFFGRVFRQSVVIEGLPRAFRPQMGREASNSVGDNSILSNGNRIVNEKRKNVSRLGAVARDESEWGHGGVADRSAKSISPEFKEHFQVVTPGIILARAAEFVISVQAGMPNSLRRNKLFPETPRHFSRGEIFCWPATQRSDGKVRNALPGRVSKRDEASVALRVGFCSHGRRWNVGIFVSDR